MMLRLTAGQPCPRINTNELFPELVTNRAAGVLPNVPSRDRFRHPSTPGQARGTKARKGHDCSRTTSLFFEQAVIAYYDE
jgi:hypothetical protein